MYQWRARRDPVGGIRDVFRQGKVTGSGRVRVNVYHYRRLSVPMICELAELEGFTLVGDESPRNSLVLIFQRRGGWGGRPPLPRRTGPT